MSSKYLEMIVKRGYGMITCGNHLGVFVSSVVNINKTPLGWVFIDSENLTMEKLEMAVEYLKKGRAGWPEKVANDQPIKIKNKNKKKKENK